MGNINIRNVSIRNIKCNGQGQRVKFEVKVLIWLYEVSYVTIY